MELREELAIICANFLLFTPSQSALIRSEMLSGTDKRPVTHRGSGREIRSSDCGACSVVTHNALASHFLRRWCCLEMEDGWLERRLTQSNSSSAISADAALQYPDCLQARDTGNTH